MDPNTKAAADRDRRRLLGSAMRGPFLASGANLISSHLAAAPQDVAIRSFRVEIPEEALLDPRRRIAARRWPDRETVHDQSQGIQLAKLQQLVRYWGAGYDWRKAEAKLNALPQFITTIDNVDIHFVQVRSPHPAVGR